MAEHGVIYTRLMNCSQWREIRSRQLGKQPWCEECLKHGVVREADVVHHRIEVETGRTEEEQRALAYSESTYDKDGKYISGNLQSLCTRCHNKYHKEQKSHSRKVHAARNAARLSAWIAQQQGRGN